MPGGAKIFRAHFQAAGHSAGAHGRLWQKNPGNVGRQGIKLSGHLRGHCVHMSRHIGRPVRKSPGCVGWVFEKGSGRLRGDAGKVPAKVPPAGAAAFFT
jgi:hypothetical protein